MQGSRSIGSTPNRGHSRSMSSQMSSCSYSKRIEKEKRLKKRYKARMKEYALWLDNRGIDPYMILDELFAE